MLRCRIRSEKRRSLSMLAERQGLIEGDRMRTRIIVIGLCAAGLALFAALPKLTSSEHAAQTPANTPPPPQVSVNTAVQKPIIEWDEYIGRFDAVESVEVRSRISGYLNSVSFQDGERVEQGQLLFQIDPRPYERAVEQAQAELEQAKTRVYNASLDVERGRPLVKDSVISQKVMDDRESVLRDAEAAVAVAEAQVKTAQLNLSFCQVTAPISGRISRKFVTPGNFISGGGTAEGTTVLTTIVTQDPIHIYFDISENAALKYKRLAEKGVENAGEVGAKVGVALPDEEGFPNEGKLDFVDNRLDASTGTLRARATIGNADGLFSAGMFARVRLQGSARYTALLVPDEAIGTDQTSRFVYVVGKDNIATRVSVELGPLSNGLRVVRSGIGTEDVIVVNGMARVRAGAPVKPIQVPRQVSSIITTGSTNSSSP